MERKENASATLRNTDIVILITGLSGAGKSTFINTFLGENRMLVNHRLTSSTTSQLDYAVIDHIPRQERLEGRRVVIVDTPGFNDSYDNDTEILRRIATWLASAFREGITLGGVIYLHDISLDRFSSMAGSDMSILRQSIAGSEEALQKVVLATTKWKRVDPSRGRAHEKELQETRWQTLMAQGSRVHQFRNTDASAWEIVNVLLEFVENDTGSQAGRAELQKLLPILKDKKARKEYVYSEVLRPIFTKLFGLGRSRNGRKI